MWRDQGHAMAEMVESRLYRTVELRFGKPLTDLTATLECYTCCLHHNNVMTFV